MRKLLSILLCLSLVLVTFAACGSSDAPEEGMEKITILYPGEESNRMNEFLEGEFAERMKTDLNMEVEMIFLPWDQYWEQKDIMLANQDPIDLYWDGLPSLSTMVNKQQAQPLDELIATYGQDMLEVLPQEQLNGGLVNGEIYGIPSAYAPSSAMFQLVCLRQDILEDVGMSEVSTAQDLMDYSLAATEMYEHVNGGGDPLLKPLTRYFAEEQYNWIASENLVVFGEETHKAYSYFETEAFQEVCKFNSEMSELGLYHDDVTNRYNERDSRVQTGNYIWVEGSLGKETEIIDAVSANAPDAVLQSYLLAPEKPKYITAAGGEVLCVPVTAPNPEGAIKFVNWFYSSVDNYNFAIYGVEGTDYEVIDGRINRLITDELFYEWMFRNQNYQMFSPDVDQEFIDMYQSWDDDAIVSESFGFRFNNENVKEIEAKLTEAATDFVALQSGYLDFDTEYEAAVQKLKEAGIDEYVAEVQRQLDEFLASK